VSEMAYTGPHGAFLHSLAVWQYQHTGNAPICHLLSSLSLFRTYFLSAPKP
jgi:hypothetical protein